MKHYFILNPAAGKGLAEDELLPKLQRLMKESGMNYEIHRSISKSDIVSYVRQRAHTGELARFYACGGDGTLNDVLNGIIGCPNAEIAAIPYGSGNDFVKNFSNFDNFYNIENQIKGTTIPVDVISYGNAFCMNMLNIGADCDVVAESIRLRTEKGLRGPTSYLAAAAKVLYKEIRYKMKFAAKGDAMKEEELLLCAVGNGQYCGGGFKSCPKAKINDGLMDVCLITPVSGLKLLTLLSTYRAGRHLEDAQCKKLITYKQCSEFTLIPKDEFNVSVDGEINPFHTEITFKVLPRAVKFSVPAGSKLRQN